MKELPRWRRYLRLAKPNVTADVDDELSFHIDMRVQDNIRRGMSAEDARRDALERFGGLEGVRDTLVDHDRTQQAQADRREWFADLRQDVSFGFRGLRRAPGFAIASILTLAVGIGANTAIYSVVDALLFRPLPYARPEQLVSLGSGSAGELFGLRERLRSFSDIAAYTGRQYGFDNGGEVTRLHGVAVTTNLFRTLGVPPQLGSTFTEQMGLSGNATVVILSHRLWQRQFGGAPDVIGKRVLLEAVPFTVIGVMPESFHYPSNTTEFWVPLTFNPENRGAHWAIADRAFVARVKDGVSIDMAAKDVHTTWPTLRALNPLWDAGDKYAADATATPLQDRMIGAPKSLLWLLLGCVSLVLLVACVNVANLLLARATARERELAVRAAVGGGRLRLVRQLITESVLLSAIGAVLGVGIALGMVRWLVSAMPPGIPRVEEIAVNGTVLMVTGGVAVITGLLFGIVPALRATAASGGLAMIGTKRATQGARHHRVAGLLVGAEVALAVMLVIGAQLLVRSFAELRSVDTGFESSHVIAARLSPPGGKYREEAQLMSFFKSVMARLEATPGVERVAITDKLPIAMTVWGMATRIEGQWEDGSKVLPDIHHMQSVTGSYFSTMQIPVLQGRSFDENDGPSTNPVAIVSQGMAKKFWPNQSALGKRIGYAWPSPWLTIVGVVPDVRLDSLRDTLPMSIYVPWQQRSRMSFSEMWVVVRTTNDPAALTGTIRGIVSDIDRTVAVSGVRTMDEVLAQSVQRDRFMLIMVALFAATALLLGTVGIYGVMSYLVSQRTQEMGVRIALGASAGNVIGMVIRRGAIMAGAGAVIGVIAAVWATKPLAAFLYGVSPTDPLTFVSVPVAFLLVALLASLVPARRATRVDPVRALRAD